MLSGSSRLCCVCSAHGFLVSTLFSLSSGSIWVILLSGLSPSTHWCLAHDPEARIDSAVTFMILWPLLLGPAYVHRAMCPRHTETTSSVLLALGLYISMLIYVPTSSQKYTLLAWALLEQMQRAYQLSPGISWLWTSW